MPLSLRYFLLPTTTLARPITALECIKDVPEYHYIVNGANPKDR